MISERRKHISAKYAYKSQPKKFIHSSSCTLPKSSSQKLPSHFIVSMSTSRTTRGFKLHIDESLKPQTRVERAAKKQEQQAYEKAKKEAEAAAKDFKEKKSRDRITSVEDQRALEQQKCLSVRPDLDIRGNIPPKPPSQRAKPAVRPSTEPIFGYHYFFFLFK